MRAGRANRLARRADRLRGDGGRGRRARRALATLTAAADRFDPAAVAALRETWLANPREITWADVARWCATADVLAAAVDPRRTAAARAALGGFCVRHDLVPDNDIERALFYVLTGQHERYEALDPDGTLLSAGYRGASDATRTALRQTMLDLGAVSLVRVIADRPDRTLTMAEGDYLATRLAHARDWDQLWRLVPTIPLAGALRAARLFGDWRPPDDAGRRLLTTLAAADQKVVGALTDAATTRVRIAYPSGLSFAPDGTQLAVSNAKGVTVVLPRTGKVYAEHADRELFDVLALGAGAVVYNGGRRADFSYLYRARNGPSVVLTDKPGSTVGATPDGFVLSHGRDLEFHASRWRLRQVTVGAEHLGPGRTALGMAASDPATGRLVLRVGTTGEDSELELFDADLNSLARLAGERHANTAFCGPDRLLLWRWGDKRSIGSWRREDETFVRTARTDLDAAFMHPVPLPARGQVVIRRRTGLAWLDAETLTEVAGPPGLPNMDARLLAFSRDGTLIAVAPDGDATVLRSGVVVYDLGLCALSALFDTSLARMVPADLATVEAQARRNLAPPEAVELLRAGLAYRFGADIALGSGDRVPAGAEDVALGGDR